MGMQLSLDQDVRYLKGVGPKRAKELNSLGVETVQDLLDYFPADKKDPRFKPRR